VEKNRMSSNFRVLTAAAVSLIALAAPSVAEATVQVSQSGWAWGNPSPQGNSIRAMSFSGLRGYAVGDAGTALRTDDGGATWKGLVTGTTNELTRVQVVTPDVVTIQSQDGCALRRSTDGGATFNFIYVVAEQNCPNPVAATSFVSPTVGYLILKDGSVLRTTDGGDSFSKQTAVPGTAASSSADSAIRDVNDVWFTGANAGFALTSGGTFHTTDAGVSWQPVTTPAVNRRILFVDANVAYEYGGSDITKSIDGGVTWTDAGATVPGGVSAMTCTSADACIVVPTAGDKLLRTDDGAATLSPITPASRALYTAAYASSTRVVAAGDGGTTVASNDGGMNFSRVGGDIGGSYTQLRSGGAPLAAFALGRKGALARTADGGNTWSILSVPTSSDILDVAFSSNITGYALDSDGGLFKTNNGGNSWQTLDPGTSSSARALATVGSDVVLLVGPKGVLRQTGDGRFDPVTDRDVKSKALTGVDVNGSSVVVFGPQTLAVSPKGGGAAWNTVALPNPDKKKHNTLKLAAVDFTGSKTGYVTDTKGRLFHTKNTGKTWTELPGLGSSAGLTLSFGDDKNGFVGTRYAENTSDAYVERTSDGGKTWRPQRLAVGTVVTGGIVSAGDAQAYALVAPQVGRPDLVRELFSTTTGGDAGTVTTLSIKPSKTKLTKKQLKKVKGKITVRGTLAGAQGGERVVVSARSSKGTKWTTQVVTVGANGGSFTASFKISSSSIFVARWAGGSGRRGVGTKAVPVTVK
jgi:photosystem II stability/assembly factor-like uncharacterized protein